MATQIQIEFNHRVEEYIDAYRLYYSQRTKWFRADRIVAVALLGFGVVAVSLAGVRWWTMIWFVLAPLEFFNLLSIDPLVIRWQFKNTPKFHQRNMLTFTDDGIHYQTATVDSRLDWQTYSEILENERLFLLVYGKRMYSVIPKHAFKGEAELNDFRQLLCQRLGQRTGK